MMQEVFLQTWEYIVSGSKAIGNVQSFLYRVAYNKIADHYRGLDRQAVLLDDLEEHVLPTDHVNQQEVEVDLVKRNIKKLKPEYYDILLLRFVEGLSIREIAEIIDKDVNNVRVTLHRAMESLKKYYSKSKS